MIGGKSFRWTRQRFAFELAEGFADGRLLEDPSKIVVIIEEPVTDGSELFFLRHVRACCNDNSLRAHLKVVAGAGGFIETGMRPPRGNVRFIGTLVVAEARVAIDAKDRFFCRPHVIGREVDHRVGNFADDGEHRLFE